MDLDDLQLVQRARSDRRAGFDPLMQRYERLVYKVCSLYGPTRDDTLDITQNVFLKVYKNLASVKSEGMFKPWLLRITYNESINWLRKRKVHEEFEELGEHDHAAENVNQEMRVLRKENQGLVLKGLQALNPKYKLAVSLRYAEGMRIREIADVMECSEGMVKSLLFRGVRQIRNNVANLA